MNTLIHTAAEPSNISAILYSNSGLVPLRKRSYELQAPDGVLFKGTTDGDGYLEHHDVPAGDYALQIDGVSGWVPTVRDPKERLPVRVDGYYLIHREEPYRPEQGDSSAAAEEQTDGEWESLDPVSQDEALFEAS